MKNENPRFEFVYEKACDFLLSSSINTLPINPITLIKQNHWGLVTYSELCRITGTKSQEDIREAFISKDGFTIANGNNFCIAYNDSITSKGRVNFTLMHEIGHIVLLHFDIKSEEDKKRCYKAFEEEANYFASNVLAPKAVIRACEITSAKLLSAACGISGLAARTRINSVLHEDFLPVDYEIAKKFETYIEVVKRRTAVSVEI